MSDDKILGQVPSREKEIPGLLGCIDGEIERIGEATSVLSGALANVCGPMPPEIIEKIPDNALTSTGKLLDTHLRRLSEIRHNLLSLINRLEI